MSSLTLRKATRQKAKIRVALAGPSGSGKTYSAFLLASGMAPYSLNKNVSELCDTAIVFRTAGPRDQEAVEEWFSTKATREQRDAVMRNLAGLDTGTTAIG